MRRVICKGLLIGKGGLDYRRSVAQQNFSNVSVEQALVDYTDIGAYWNSWPIKIVEATVKE